MCLRAGDIGDVLQAASDLPRLTKMDFTNQFLTGTLPANISLPALEELILVNNDITVRSLTLPTPIALMFSLGRRCLLVGSIFAYCRALLVRLVCLPFASAFVQMCCFDQGNAPAHQGFLTLSMTLCKSRL